MYIYTDDDDRTMAAESAAHHAVEKERAKDEKEKAALVRAIFAEVDVLLSRNTEKINFTDGTFKLYFNRKLEVDLADLEKKYKKKYTGGSEQ
ncbi:MAG: hypothetical protein IKI93_18310 [Clostridia bacterium]|nr:hypothetical protein [Clostridia bacterium]